MASQLVNLSHDGQYDQTVTLTVIDVIKTPISINAVTPSALLKSPVNLFEIFLCARNDLR